ncbi:hypothetical protein T11_8179 [Trichinella zimbabwensis]|uniref:Uncharacterized protein n=1 Tax=Trichinella zimbabwensis TaxID=268475 RepID=A0A0V1GSA9_9BILA|nr:hypothetical protein T11_8179 [Trichinella zimbabwensis]
MYSDGQSANFTGHSLDKYRIVFNQTLQHSNLSICNSSWKETIKNFRKTLFHTKPENSKGYSHEILKFLKIVFSVKMRSTVKNKLEITNDHGRTFPDYELLEILQNNWN